MMDDTPAPEGQVLQPSQQRKFSIRPSQRHQLCTTCVKFWRTALINVDATAWQ